MNLARLLLPICLSLPLALLAGCGGSESESDSDSTAPKTIQASDLPKMDAVIEAELDNGRVKAAPPKDWTLLSRHQDYVVRFKAAASVQYPMILVTAKDYENVVDVTKDNVDEFAKQIASALAAGEKPAKLYEEVRPIQVKSLAGATYLRRANAKGTVVDRFFVETVHGGRKYTVELRTPKGTLDQYRAYPVAVAAALQFTGTGPAVASSGEESGAEEGTTEETAAEEEPDEGEGFLELDE